MEFSQCISIELEYDTAGLLALHQCIVILANGEFAGRVLGNNIPIHTVKHERQTGLSDFRLFAIRVDDQLTLAIDDAMYASN